MALTKGEATKRAILDGALVIASRHGLEGLTIGKLAEETGLSKSGLFAHFGSKQNLDVEVVGAARERFIAEVIAPALQAPRGEPRVRALVDRWLAWGGRPGGCIFVALSAELDDQPGPARDALEEAMRDLLDVIANAARIAVAEGHFAKGLDTQQFAFELYGIMLASHHLIRFHKDPKGLARTRKAFERLVDNSRA
jgi:AcrR family transcriptional regulator